MYFLPEYTSKVVHVINNHFAVVDTELVLRAQNKTEVEKHKTVYAKCILYTHWYFMKQNKMCTTHNK